MKIIRPLIRKALRLFGYDIIRLVSLWRSVDDRDIHIVAKVTAYTLTPPDAVGNLLTAVRYIVENRIPGDIVECGVWRGGSMMAVALLLVSLGIKDRTIWMYDTYSGMPESGEHDFPIDPSLATRKQLLPSIPGLEEVRRNMKSTGYDNLRYVVGRVEETVPRFAPEQISLLRLDTDFYDSTKHELEHLYPRLSAGGVLIIDDYNFWYGSKKATDEYFRGKKILLVKFSSNGAVVGLKQE